MSLFRRGERGSAGAEQSSISQPPVKATDLFKEVLTSRWAPLLRAEGFKGSGKVYVLPDERDWVMLGFQSSTSSSAAGVKFTINLLVAGKAPYEAARERASYLSARPSPNVLGGPYRYLQRVGQLTHGADHWWWLRAGENAEPVIEEIIQVLAEIAIPKLRAEMNDQSPGPRGTFEKLAKGR